MSTTIKKKDPPLLEPLGEPLQLLNATSASSSSAENVSETIRTSSSTTASSQSLAASAQSLAASARSLAASAHSFAASAQSLAASAQSLAASAQSFAATAHSLAESAHTTQYTSDSTSIMLPLPTHSHQERLLPTSSYTRTPSTSPTFSQAIGGIGGCSGVLVSLAQNAPVFPSPAEGYAGGAFAAMGFKQGVEWGSTMPSSFSTLPPEPVKSDSLEELDSDLEIDIKPATPRPEPDKIEPELDFDLKLDVKPVLNSSPAPVKIDPLQELELALDMDMKSILLPNGHRLEAQDLRGLTRHDVEQLRKMFRPQSSEGAPRTQMESLKEKKIMKKELVDLALFENEWWQKTTDGFAPLRQIPRVVSTDVEYEDDGTDHPRGYPTLIYEKSTLPGHRGLERADHQRSTYQVTDQEFRIKVEEDTNPHGNPDIKPETQASPASGDDGLGSWVVVHWNFIPEGDVAERIRQDSMTRLATQFDRTFYDMISRWEQNVELRFQVVEVEERDDELQAYEDDEQDNTDTVVGTAAFAALAAEVDDFLDDLGFELGIQNKRKRESEVDVDIEVNKRPRSQSLSTEPDFSSWYR